MASCVCEISREEAEGRKAFRAGLSDLVCPHESGMSNARTRWMSGYWGERVDRFLERYERKCEKPAQLNAPKPNLEN